MLKFPWVSHKSTFAWSYLPGFPSTRIVTSYGIAAIQTAEPCVYAEQILGTLISGSCPLSGMGPECSVLLGPASPHPGARTWELHRDGCCDDLQTHKH